jgi:membrane-associated phospholipid phosphatase
MMFMVGSAITALLMALINLKWKISAHMAGIGGVIALIYQIHVMGLSAFDLLWLLCLSIVVAGALGSARLALRRHDILQVLAGVVLGFLCVMLTMRFLG